MDLNVVNRPIVMHFSIAISSFIFQFVGEIVDICFLTMVFFLEGFDVSGKSIVFIRSELTALHHIFDLFIENIKILNSFVLHCLTLTLMEEMSCSTFCRFTLILSTPFFSSIMEPLFSALFVVYVCRNWSNFASIFNIMIVH